MVVVNLDGVGKGSGGRHGGGGAAAAAASSSVGPLRLLALGELSVPVVTTAPSSPAGFVFAAVEAAGLDDTGGGVVSVDILFIYLVSSVPFLGQREDRWLG